jgi:hypothetical protein
VDPSSAHRAPPRGGGSMIRMGPPRSRRRRSRSPRGCRGQQPARADRRAGACVRRVDLQRLVAQTRQSLGNGTLRIASKWSHVERHPNGTRSSCSLQR